MSSPSDLQENARRLLEKFTRSDIANPNISFDNEFDFVGDKTKEHSSCDLYGRWYRPTDIIDSLLMTASTETNVGKPQLPPSVMVQSLSYQCIPYLDLSTCTTKKWHDIPLQIQNHIQDSETSNLLRLRWITENGETKSSHVWNLPSSPSVATGTSASDASVWIQYCRPGHLFLLSLVLKTSHELEEDLFSSPNDITDNDEEILLGGYRPIRPLPSGSFHTLVIRQIDDVNDAHLDTKEIEEGANDDKNLLEYLVKSVMMDPYDGLCHIAASLDIVTTGDATITQTTKSHSQTMYKLLKTIISNIIQHPQDEKYRKLRLSNPKIQNYIGQSKLAFQFLTLVGLEKQTMMSDNVEETWLIAPIQSNEEETILIDIRMKAIQILEILLSHVSSDFVVDLAPETPWQFNLPSLNGSQRHESHRRGFLTDEERWARAERIAQLRRSGRARRPNPGEAPSSRGKWGR